MYTCVRDLSVRDLTLKFEGVECWYQMNTFVDNILGHIYIVLSFVAGLNKQADKVHGMLFSGVGTC